MRNWVLLVVPGFISAHALSFTLVFWMSNTSPSPPYSLLVYAYCNGRCFAAGVITGAVRRAAILSEASRWALKTAWRVSLQGIEGDCWTASDYIALQMEVTLSTFSLAPRLRPNTWEREAGARSVPVAKKAGIWCANRTNLKTWCRKPRYILCYLLRQAERYLLH